MLPYDAEALLALYSRYLRELWPITALLPLLTLSVIPAAAFGARYGGRVAGALLASGWLWVGLVFQFNYFARINFAAPPYAGLFVLQGVLLIWQGPIRQRLGLRLRTDLAGWLGILIGLFALLIYPLLDYLAGQPASNLRLAGLAPGPTALFTLAVLLHSAGHIPLHLLAIPVAWSSIAGFSGWVLGMPGDLVMPLPAILALAAALIRNRRESG